MSFVIGIIVGIIGGYLYLYNDLLKFGRNCGFRCDKCKANHCFAKRCWYNYHNLHHKQ